MTELSRRKEIKQSGSNSQQWILNLCWLISFIYTFCVNAFLIKIFEYCKNMINQKSFFPHPAEKTALLGSDTFGRHNFRDFWEFRLGGWWKAFGPERFLGLILLSLFPLHLRHQIIHLVIWTVIFMSFLGTLVLGFLDLHFLVFYSLLRSILYVVALVLELHLVAGWIIDRILLRHVVVLALWVTLNSKLLARKRVFLLFFL